VNGSSLNHSPHLVHHWHTFPVCFSSAAPSFSCLLASRCLQSDPLLHPGIQDRRNIMTHSQKTTGGAGGAQIGVICPSSWLSWLWHSAIERQRAPVVQPVPRSRPTLLRHQHKHEPGSGTTGSFEWIGTEKRHGSRSLRSARDHDPTASTNREQ
jgi:hypothetical protein